MVVIKNCDFNQTKAATIEISKYNGPVSALWFEGRKYQILHLIYFQNFEIGKELD